MTQSLDKVAFLKKYDLEQKFEKADIEWTVLEAIYYDYLQKKNEFTEIANITSNALMAFSKVHSVRSRVKDPEHLIEKIIRKKVNKIDVANYQNLVSDLIGIRAMHLFKDDWIDINREIKESFFISGKPEAKIRKGDSEEVVKKIKDLGLKVVYPDSGYRSIHYELKIKNNKRTYLVELQLRTIFEEGWSEIDHTISYPYSSDPIIGEFLLILNRLAGSADEMGSFVIKLKRYQTEQKKITAELHDKINELQVSQESKNTLFDGIERLLNKEFQVNIPNGIEDFSAKLNRYKNIAMLNNFSENFRGNDRLE